MRDGQIILRPTFSKKLDGLRRSWRRHHQRASEILLSCRGFNFAPRREDLSRNFQTV